MADEPFESMAAEAGLDPAEYADVTAMCGAVRTAAADLPAPAPGTELAAMLGAPPVRRIARRRRIASATGATALVLGSLGGAAAADVLPEPVQGVVTEFPGFPGGPAPLTPGAPPTSAEASPSGEPEGPDALPSASPHRLGAALDVVPPPAPRSRSARPDDLPGQRNGADKRPAAPPASRSPRPTPGPPDDPGSRGSDGSDKSGSADPGTGNADGWPGQRRPLPRPVESGSGDADRPSSTGPSQRR